MSDSIRGLSELPELATPQEVSKALRCSSRFVQDECKAGRMKVALVAGRYLITPDDVRAYLAERSNSRKLQVDYSGKPTNLSVRPGKKKTFKTETASERLSKTVAELKAQLKGR